MPRGFRAVRLEEKFALFQEQWRPKIIAQMNDYHFKLVKIQGTSSGIGTPRPMKSSSCRKGVCASICATGRRYG